MISPPFELLSLPNVQAEKLSHKPVCLDGSNIHIGVSQSSVTTVSLRPSRVVGAFSVPPNVDITAVATDLKKDGSCIAYASNERKKHYLKVVDSAHSRQLSQEVSMLHYSNGCFVAIYPDTSAEAFAVDTFETKWTKSVKKGSKYLYSAMVDEGVCVLVSTKSKSSFTVEMLAFDPAGVHQLRETVVEVSGSIGTLSYCDGTIYRCENRTVQLYSLPEATLVTEFDIQGEAIQDMIALSNNNIAIVQDSVLTIIDCSYRSTVSKCDLAAGTPISLLAYSPAAETIIASSGKAVLGFTVSPSSGTLLESIGHGVAAANPQFTWGHCDLLPSLVSKTEFVPVLLENIRAAQHESLAILRTLEEAVTRQDSSSFMRVISYLKGEPWAEATVPTEDLVYDDTDRQVDREFIKSLAYLAFGVETESTTLNYLPFLSNGFAIYLLTHPLFPTGEVETADLFDELKKVPQLYRQAIVTLSSATAEDILGGVFSLDEDIFHDAVVRLNEEFGQQQITQAIQSLSRHAGAEELINVIDRLSKSQEGWVLVSPFMDTLGLLAWSEQTLDVLQKRLEVQLENVNSAVTANRLISELLMSVDIDAEDGKTLSRGEIKRRSKKSQEASSRDEPKHIPRYSVETLVLN